MTQMFVSTHVCSHMNFNKKLYIYDISLHRLWIRLLIEFGSRTIKQITTKNKFIRYLCFIADFIHGCHPCLKISSLSLEKNLRWPTTVTAISIWSRQNQFGHGNINTLRYKKKNKINGETPYSFASMHVEFARKEMVKTALCALISSAVARVI